MVGGLSVTLDRLERRALDPRSPAGAQLRRVAAKLREDPTDSGEERTALAWLIDEGLAPDKTQHRVRCSDGVDVHGDFAYLPERVSVEYLGSRWHSLPEVVTTDALRSNGAVTAGWFRLLLTDRQLEARDPASSSNCATCCGSATRAW